MLVFQHSSARRCVQTGGGCTGSVVLRRAGPGVTGAVISGYTHCAAVGIGRIPRPSASGQIRVPSLIQRRVYQQLTAGGCQVFKGETVHERGNGAWLCVRKAAFFEDRYVGGLFFRRPLG
ncbi:hypothetical protein SKAU_G00045580 [Synaphobranchus kaupii]|uniref:Uncharacterized protein n=1 Tax=Synaphobranchus kaupii TaxID=118154 RepID=A0A9Q1G2U5_SYNKA|nr:hypothetical protein SKAU_G00045580 [Synaphobranchus kaupii]